MAVPIDTSEPFLRPSQLEALTRAAASADAHDEHDWIEWKSSLELSSAEGKWHVAKQVLGFSNRTVETALRHAGGHAYLLVGVEPGAITGVTSIDHADLSNSIERYVGAVRWTPENVTVDSKTVLVIVVDPPRPGDPIFTLQKGYDRFQAGAIFVRVPGKSEQATPAQVEALVERARSTRGTLAVAVHATPATIEAGPAPDPRRLDEIVAAERELLMAPGRSKWPSRESSHPAWRVGLNIPDLRPLAANAAMYGGTEKPDKRTEAQYAEEVDEYLDNLREVLERRYIHRRYHHPAASLRLLVDNPTDRNFHNLQVVANVAGDVSMWPEEVADDLVEELNFPSRPLPLGMPVRVPGPLDSVTRTAVPYYHSLPPTNIGLGPGFTIENSGSVTITYEPIDLRPRTPGALPPVELIVREPVGTQLLVTWKATADNVDGLRSGEFNVVVVGETVPYEDVPDEE